jgi:hypothetical protein
VVGVVTGPASERVRRLQDADIGVTLHGAQADLASFDAAWRRLAPRGDLPTSSDVKLAPVLHDVLKDQSRRLLLQPRFWEWLALVELPDYVVARWVDDRLNLTGANIGRFLAGTGVSSVANHALARLYWTAEVSWVERGDYSGVQNLLSKADLHKTLFTNELCLQPRLCLAHADEMIKNYNEDEAREMVKLLGFVQTSTSYVSLSEADLQGLIKALRPSAATLAKVLSQGSKTKVQERAKSQPARVISRKKRK